MVSLVEVYERQAVDCVQAAARIDDPNYREMLLQIAGASGGWRQPHCEHRRKQSKARERDLPLIEQVRNGEANARDHRSGDQDTVKYYRRRI